MVHRGVVTCERRSKRNTAEYFLIVMIRLITVEFICIFIYSEAARCNSKDIVVYA